MIRLDLDYEIQEDFNINAPGQNGLLNNSLDSSFSESSIQDIDQNISTFLLSNL